MFVLGPQWSLLKATSASHTMSTHQHPKLHSPEDSNRGMTSPHQLSNLAKSPIGEPRNPSPDTSLKFQHQPYPLISYARLDLAQAS